MSFDQRDGKDRRRGAVRLTPGMAIVAVLILAAGTVAVWQGQRSINHNAHKIETLQEQQELALAGSCDRVNLLRFTGNRNAVTSYDTLQIIVQLTKGPDKPEAHRISMVLTRLQRTAPETVTAIVALLRPQVGLSQKFLRLSRTIRYIPATDCEHAVGTPAEFKKPPALPVWKLDHAQLERLRTTGDLPVRSKR